MEELIKLVAAKTGLSHDMAKIAVATVITHIKSLLPKMLADQIDSYLGTGHETNAATGQGPSNTQDVMGSVLKGLGGILGKK